MAFLNVLDAFFECQSLVFFSFSTFPVLFFLLPSVLSYRQGSFEQEWATGTMLAVNKDINNCFPSPGSDINGGE